MIARALEKYLKTSSKKMRLVVDLVRGKSVKYALEMLPSVNKKTADMVLQAVKSAYYNVKVKYPEEKYPEDVLYISKITANEGPSLKRYRAASMGRASMIIKRSSHLLVELDFIPEKLKEIESLKEKKHKTAPKEKESKAVKTASVKKTAKQAAVKGSK